MFVLAVTLTQSRTRHHPDGQKIRSLDSHMTESSIQKSSKPHINLQVQSSVMQFSVIKKRS